ncbi:hypothetical protein FIBSPDRAFT_118708 [Athelia psychrophila]|uniref:Uncharacterized protein n=1 Tax=Athelia psychrophila TaxID=1759441 RepID=A0A166CSU8_9AGAM|nr:hypothetical protein FIBSPDRAFT_118708 [Fibularhizoctonia sp. CBS 109695]
MGPASTTPSPHPFIHPNPRLYLLYHPRILIVIAACACHVSTTLFDVALPSFPFHSVFLGSVLISPHSLCIYITLCLRYAFL